MIIWEARTGVKKRMFTVTGGGSWPIFKWSSDDKFFARIATDNKDEPALSIYETPSFGLLDRKSIKVNGMRDFSWSPTENILAYWVAEDKDVPARVTLVEIPSRNEVIKFWYSVETMSEKNGVSNLNSDFSKVLAIFL